MNKLRQYLKDNDISVYQLSKNSGIAYSTVNYLVNGRTPIEKCELGTVMRIAGALKLSMSEAIRILINGSGDAIKVYLDEYDIDGILYCENGYYVIESAFAGSLHSRRLDECRFMYDGFEEDYGRFSLEDMYVDYILEGNI